MHIHRLPLLVTSFLVAALALGVGTAGPVAAEPPSTTFGAHVSSCATGAGFSGQHNPSHHRGPTAHDMDGMHC